MVEMFKQSHRNLGVNFISRGDEGGYLQVQCAQSGPPVANETDDAAEQEKEVAGVIPTYAVMDMSKKSKKQADKRPPEYVVMDKSKKKEKQEVAANGTDGAAEQETEVAGKKQADKKPPEYSPGGGTRVSFCWVCPAGLPEPLPHYSLFCGRSQTPF